MCRRLLLCILAIGSLAGCGDDIPPARYNTFTIELEGVAEGDHVHPGQKLSYKVTYDGDLARNLTVIPTYTHEASGEVATFPFLPLTPSDSTRMDTRGQWTLKEEFLKRSGPIRIQLQASVLATKRGSVAWIATSQSVFVELYPRLDSVEVRLPNQPAPYATPIELEVTGRELWADVALTVTNLDTGASIAGLEKRLPFDGTQASFKQSWVLRARELERIGTRRLALVARYGELQVQSAPFAFEVTHTIDNVIVRLSRPPGTPTRLNEPYPRLSDVSELVVSIVGTQLAGHAVTVNGTTVIASADEQEVLRVTPKADQFGKGKGQHTYAFFAQSGGMERQDEVTLQRWGIERCEWATAAGQPIGAGETIAPGTRVTMRAELWGFPDTTTTMWIFRSPLAEFTVWERDPGGRVDPQQKIDPLNNNDDEVDSFDGEVRSSRTQTSWNVVHDEEVGIVLDPFHLNAAEYYFEVVLEDQVCDSSEIWVYPP